MSAPGRAVTLVGFMAAGKSTVGARLAARLGWRLFDTDAEIAARADCEVAEIFARFGEGRFRALEHGVIEDALAAGGDRVLALGGGALGDRRSARAIFARTRTVHLRASPSVLAARIGASSERRPLAPGGAFPAALYRGRVRLFRACELEVSTDDRSPDEVAGEIAGWLAARGVPA